MTWPTEVPVVNARCCWKDDFHSPDGKHHCLAGWFMVMFGIDERRRAHRLCSMILGHSHITGWNDAPQRKKAEIAQLVNRTTAVLGFVVGNPEAAFARRWWKKHGKPREADE